MVIAKQNQFAWWHSVLWYVGQGGSVVAWYRIAGPSGHPLDQPYPFGYCEGAG